LGKREKKRLRETGRRSSERGLFGRKRRRAGREVGGDEGEGLKRGLVYGRGSKGG
jgi:hypothetical protein